MTTTNDDLVTRIREALSDRLEDNLPALAIVLVEQALNFRRRDGTTGTRTEVKHFVTTLTNGMIDICTEDGSPFSLSPH